MPALIFLCFETCCLSKKTLALVLQGLPVFNPREYTPTFPPAKSLPEIGFNIKKRF